MEAAYCAPWLSLEDQRLLILETAVTAGANAQRQDNPGTAESGQDAGTD
jgi:hypothetical protein